MGIKRVKIVPLCACGCGEEVRWSQNYKGWNRFILGHHARVNHPMSGRHHTKEVCRAQSLRASKRRHTKEERLKKSIAMLGGNNHMFGKKVSIESRQKMSESHKGCVNPNKGKKFPEASKRMLDGGAAYANSFIKNPSKPQTELYSLVKLLYPNAILNHPSLNRSIDIAIPGKMIAIEYDGSYWHTGQETSDRRRQKELEDIGWKFLRYCDYVPLKDELERDLESIRKMERITVQL